MTPCKPIIFSGPMVRAILAGTKTQTRRIVKDVPMFSADYDRQWNPHVCLPSGACPEHWTWWEGPAHGPSIYHTAKLPYAPGDLLWVREAWGWLQIASMPPSPDYPQFLKYRGTEPDAFAEWRSPIHMPRWASRITLEVTAVRVQRLQDISEDDAKAEGATERPECCGYGSLDPGWCMDWSRVGTKSRYSGNILQERDIAMSMPRWAFASFWNSIHGTEAWNANPWVAAYSFRRVMG